MSLHEYISIKNTETSQVIETLQQHSLLLLQCPNVVVTIPLTGEFIIDWIILLQQTRRDTSIHKYSSIRQQKPHMQLQFIAALIISCCSAQYEMKHISATNIVIIVWFPELLFLSYTATWMYTRQLLEPQSSNLKSKLNDLLCVNSMLLLLLSNQ